MRPEPAATMQSPSPNVNACIDVGKGFGLVLGWEVREGGEIESTEWAWHLLKSKVNYS